MSYFTLAMFFDRPDRCRASPPRRRSRPHELCDSRPALFDGLGERVAAALGVHEAILDGEVVAADETGRPQFFDLIGRTRTPAYAAFDIVWRDGTDLRSLPLIQRRKRLQAISHARARPSERVAKLANLRGWSRENRTDEPA